jgi:DNA-binding NarL/FixJ family response regulator
VTPAQRRVLAALCRPLTGPGYAAPAANQQIADELVISVDTVKRTLSALFERFGLEQLPQNQKRAALAARALDLLARE